MRRKETRRQRLKNASDEMNGRIQNHRKETHPTNTHSRSPRFDDAEEEENDSNLFQSESQNHNKIKRMSEHNSSYEENLVPDDLDPSLNNNLKSISRRSRSDASGSDHESSIELSFQPSENNSRARDKNESDSESVVHIELIYCENCERSTAPATHERFCKTFDANGIPKCVSMRSKKRKVYNAAKVRGSLCVCLHLFVKVLNIQIFPTPT